MAKELIKEAETREEILARLETTQKIYNLRKEELEDPELWGEMSKGVKKIYIKILSELELTISKLQRRLQRIEAGEPVEMEEGIIGDVIPDGVEDDTLVEPEFDIEKEIIASEEPTVLVIDNVPTEESPEKQLMSYNPIDGLISGIEKVLSKFKKETPLESLKMTDPIMNQDEDVNSDSSIIAIPPTSEDNREVLKGELDEVEKSLSFTEEQISDTIYDEYYIWGGHVGHFIIEVPNDIEHKELIKHSRYKISIDYKAPDYLRVYASDIADGASIELAKRVKDNIIYQLKLRQ